MDEHLVRTWGKSKAGGVPYYLMDNEPSIWFSTHRDIHPDRSACGRISRQGRSPNPRSIKKLDPNAQVVAPEEWGWEGLFLFRLRPAIRGRARLLLTGRTMTDMQGGMDYIPWLLSQWKAAGHPVDVLSVHFYPQGGEDSDDNSQRQQLLRNRSTRQLWDQNYVSESWIGDKVDLIPRMKGWISELLL